MSAAQFRLNIPLPEASDLTTVIDALTAANIDFLPAPGHRPASQAVPSPEALQRIVSALRSVLFPAHFGPADRSAQGIRDYIAQRLDGTLQELREQIRRGFLFTGHHGDAVACERHADEVLRGFTARLPAIRTLLGTDIRAAYDGDPAATSLDEAVFCYPGITAITHHRIAHQLHQLGVPLIPRIITEVAHDATGVDIHPAARIGASFFIDHGTGVVIGETAVIGDRVRIYQGVTLGAKRFPSDPHGRPIKGQPRHPIVEDDVTIYAGATILGRITIGRGSVIGGNVWLTRGVSPGSWVSQAQARDDLFEGGSGI